MNVLNPSEYEQRQKKNYCLFNYTVGPITVISQQTNLLRFENNKEINKKNDAKVFKVFNNYFCLSISLILIL